MSQDVLPLGEFGQMEDKLWGFCQQANVTEIHLPIAAAEIEAKPLRALI